MHQVQSLRSTVGDDVSDRLTCVGEAGDHKGLVKIPRIFLALPDPPPSPLRADDEEVPSHA
jgi:hypothetical protein